MINLLEDLKKIKDEYLELKYRHYKTKKANQNRFDKLHDLRLRFLNLSYEINWSNIDVSKLNLMAPHAGPWHLLHAHDFKNEGFYFSFKFKGSDDRYVGEYSLLENKCGIDNLKIIINQIK